MNKEAEKIPVSSYGMMCSFSNVMDYISWRHASPTFNKAVALRTSSGSTMASEDLINEVIAVGKNMARDTKFFLLATRVLAELGAQIIKTYYCEDFEKAVAKIVHENYIPEMAYELFQELKNK